MKLFTVQDGTKNKTILAIGWRTVEAVGKFSFAVPSQFFHYLGPFMVLTEFSELNGNKCILKITLNVIYYRKQLSGNSASRKPQISHKTTLYMTSPRVRNYQRLKSLHYHLKPTRLYVQHSGKYIAILRISLNKISFGLVTYSRIDAFLKMF
jgi:hypothetical protein